MSVDFQQKRILVTRNEPQASRFAEQINLRGGEAIVTPLIQIACTCTQEVDTKTMNTYEWIVFTSANGVRCFFESIKTELVSDVKFAVVGSKTNETLQAFGYEADFIPSVYNAKTMAPEFIQQMQPTGPVLIVHGRLSGTIVNEALLEARIPFDCLQVYDTVTNVHIRATLQEKLAEGIDCLTFTSPSTVDGFIKLVDDPSSFYNIPVFAIGTTTEKRAIDQGFTHVFVPDVFTIEGMLDRIDQYIRRKGKDEHHDE